MKKNKVIDDPRDRTFLVTDGCMWEQNKKGGTFHPHSIEVVDTETGQTRYIKSGAVIQFIQGQITPAREQKDYNKFSAKNPDLLTPKET